MAPEGAPVLAVVDGRGRVREWEALARAGHWSSVVALCAAATPPQPARRVTEVVTGTERVDLGQALAVLPELFGARLMRVDSGGGLTGALVERGLVDEVSLVVHPLLAGPGELRWHGGAAQAALELVAARTLEDGLVWLRCRVR